MPYIRINVSEKIDPEKIQTVKQGFGSIIEVLGKTEKGLMIEFYDNHPIFLGGSCEELNIFLEMRILGRIDENMRKSFVNLSFELLNRELGIEPGHLYTNILEVMQWGTGSQLKIRETIL